MMLERLVQAVDSVCAVIDVSHLMAMDDALALD